MRIPRMRRNLHISRRTNCRPRDKDRARCRAKADNRWVMVTGGTGGIGKALIARLAVRGQNVVATAREPERIPKAGPGRIARVRLDLEQPERMAAAVREVAEIVGGTGFRVWSTWPASLSKARLRRSRRGAAASTRDQCRGPACSHSSGAADVEASPRQGGEHRRHIRPSDCAVLRAHRSVEIRARLPQRRHAVGIRAIWN